MKLYYMTLILFNLQIICAKLVTKYGWTTDAGIIITYNALSLANCRSECESRARCKSVTYVRSLTTCCLHQAMTSSEEGTIFRKAGSIYIGVFPTQEALLCGDMLCSESEKCDKTNTVPLCIVTECPDVDMSLTVVSLGNTKHVGSKRRFSCLNGSDGNDVPRASAICQADGHWQRSNISCKPEFKIKRYDMIPYGMNDLVGQMTLSECITQCLHDWNCNAIGHNENGGKCGLSLRRLSVYQVTYIDNPGWISLNKIKLPVWYSKGPYQERYQLTFSEATEYCLSQHTTMATRADVLKANAQGMSYCGWGWVSDGYAVISTQERRVNCEYAGVTDWKFGWGDRPNDVYCKNTDYTEEQSIWL